MSIPGSKIIFGGNPLKNHKIPSIYGAFEPTLIYVPINEMKKQKYFKIATTELFGPFSIVTDYSDKQLDLVLDLLESLPNHLTAATVSNDPVFLNYVNGRTINGTTY